MSPGPDSVELCRLEVVMAAPVDDVFDLVAHADRQVEVVPQLTAVDRLDQGPWGIGTRYREHRAQGRRQVTSIVEVVDYQPAASTALRSEEADSVWETVITTRPDGPATVVEVVVWVAGRTRWSRLLNRLSRRLVTRSAEADLAALAARWEPAKID